MPRPRKNPNDPKWQANESAAPEATQQLEQSEYVPESPLETKEPEKPAKSVETHINVQAGTPEAIQLMNIYEKMLHIENELPKIEKGGTNEAQGGWKYMEHPAIVAELRPLFFKYRVKYTFTELSNAITPQEGWDKDAKQVVPRGAKSLKHMRHALVNIDNPNDIYIGETFSEANSTSDKASNASSTYGQKLFYIRAFNLTDQDPDAQALEASPEKPADTIKPDKQTKIYTMLKRMGVTPDEYEANLTAHYEKPMTVKDLTNAQADDIIASMTAEITRIMGNQPEA